jgi:hypothetical protein
MHPLMTEAIVHQRQAERRRLAERHRMGRTGALARTHLGPPIRPFGGCCGAASRRLPPTEADTRTASSHTSGRYRHGISTRLSRGFDPTTCSTFRPLRRWRQPTTRRP